MTFAWHGFALEHPEDWAPVTLTGTRQEGYARIASPGRHSFQVRWKVAKDEVELSSRLEEYLGLLERDAKRAKLEFRSRIDQVASTMTYRYASAMHGRGAILQSKPSGRVFFLEVTSPKSDSLLAIFRKLLDSFSADSEGDRWALEGLDLKLPKGLDVEKRVSVPGRTQLLLTCKKARIEAQRWAMAEQLVARHGLEPWARAVMALPKSQSNSTDEGVRFSQDGSMLKSPIYGLAQVQSDRNQITTVKVETREDGWRPSWDWFA